MTSLRAGRLSPAGFALGPGDLGSRVEIHGSHVAVAYVCPHCLTGPRTDVEPVGGKTWRDFALPA